MKDLLFIVHSFETAAMEDILPEIPIAEEVPLPPSADPLPSASEAATT